MCLKIIGLAVQGRKDIPFSLEILMADYRDDSSVRAFVFVEEQVLVLSIHTIAL